ncbi:MAG: transcriptional repressor [Cohaesibacter sp.]|nr:transcriptional repressor [Cohaesibacter sp.]MCV6601997.1 transcriptional repressor [Cohaesibacter sp.]
MIELEEHDHAKCVDRILSHAELLCQQRGVRLTEQRRKVLAVLADSHVPASAYDILDKINRQGNKLAPVSIYRALEFLTGQGLIHRIESRNGYVACTHAHSSHDDDVVGGCRGDHVTVFLLCDQCGRAGEFHSDALQGLLETIAATQKFRANAPVLEISGLCSQCQNSFAEERMAEDG